MSLSTRMDVLAVSELMRLDALSGEDLGNSSSDPTRAGGVRGVPCRYDGRSMDRSNACPVCGYGVSLASKLGTEVSPMKCAQCGTAIERGEAAGPTVLLGLYFLIAPVVFVIMMPASRSGLVLGLCVYVTGLVAIALVGLIRAPMVVARMHDR